MAASDPTLKRWYRKYNRLYFKGELPEDTAVYWEPADGNLGDTHEVEDGEFVIRIDPCLRFSDKMAKMTLMHELVHVKYPNSGDHGRVFQREMLRLAKVGAFNLLW